MDYEAMIVVFMFGMAAGFFLDEAMLRQQGLK